MSEEIAKCGDEVWAPIQGYEGLYEISTHGRIRSLERYVVRRHNKRPMRIRERIMAVTMGGNGYWDLVLSNNGRYCRRQLHRLLAQTFIPNPDNLPQVNHINGDKLDNRLENLEWITCQGNTQHAVRLGLLILPKGENAYRAILNDGDVETVWQLKKDGMPNKAIAQRVGVSLAAVRSVLYGGTWSHLPGFVTRPRPRAGKNNYRRGLRPKIHIKEGA